VAISGKILSPLDGARLKVVRAQIHLDSLKDEIRDYINSNPYKVPVRVQYDTSRFPIITITRDPALETSLIIGDCVTNLRAALDYVVWALAERHFAPALDPKSMADRRIACFPIYDPARTNSYEDRLKSLVKRGMPTNACVEIDAVQSHKTGNRALSLLHELVNTDKHRLPILTLGAIGNFSYSASIIDGVQYMDPPAGHPIWDNPDNYFNTKWSDAEREEMGVNCNVSVFVTFQNVTMPREPVDRTLENILKTVADIIPRFERFFPN